MGYRTLQPVVPSRVVRVARAHLVPPHEAEDAQTIVDRDDNKILPQLHGIGAVSPLLVPRASGVRATVDPEHYCWIYEARGVRN
jgi:hypothetical protein